PDFVEVTIHSYRHRYRNAPGDPQYEQLEQALVAQPPISVPTIVLHGEANGIVPEMSDKHRRKFLNLMESRNIPRAGHNLPAEAPEILSHAVLKLLSATA